MSRFEEFVAIDWSGARQVYTQAIAVASCSAAGKLNLLRPPQATLWSRQLVFEYLLKLASQNKRVLVGIDCNLGLPAAVVHNLLPSATDARQLWKFLYSLAPDLTNFYAEPVWSAPSLSAHYWHQGKMPVNWPNLQRQCEKACMKMGLGRPESTLKLIGSKQVGKGGLAGMLMLHSLAQQSPNIAIWPFDRPSVIAKARVVICEIYPRLWLLRAGIRTKIRSLEELKFASAFLNAGTAKQIHINDHDADALIAAAGLRLDSMNAYNLDKQVFSHTPSGKSIKLEGWIHSVPVQK